MTRVPQIEALASLGEGDRLPHIVAPPPGPRSAELAALLTRHEAPGINTIVDGQALVWEAARGSNVVDVDGNRYVDLTAGFGAASVGHAHPALVAAVQEQSERLVHGLGDVAAHPTRIELARRLSEWLPVDEAQVYFAVSGADAVEVALKTAVLATGRSGVLSFDPSYHGLTLGPLSVSARDHFRTPFESTLRPGVRHLDFGCDPARVAATLDSAEVGREIGGVIVEPIVGREGVLLPPDGWLSEIAAITRRSGALLIADEILTGFGRTGVRFAVEADGVAPDVVVCGKALGGGLPIGVAAARREVMAAWAAPGEARHTGTFVGHPLACAAALTVLERIDRDRLVERAKRLGAEIGARIAAWPDRFERCREVRGRGLLWGVELDTPAGAAGVARALLARGYITLAGGADGRIVTLSPPLTIARPQLEGALDALESVLEG